MAISVAIHTQTISGLIPSLTKNNRGETEPSCKHFIMSLKLTNLDLSKFVPVPIKTISQSRYRAICTSSLV